MAHASRRVSGRGWFCLSCLRVGYLFPTGIVKTPSHPHREKSGGFRHVTNKNPQPPPGDGHWREKPPRQNILPSSQPKRVGEGGAKPYPRGRRSCRRGKGLRDRLSCGHAKGYPHRETAPPGDGHSRENICVKTYSHPPNKKFQEGRGGSLRGGEGEPLSKGVSLSPLKNQPTPPTHHTPKGADTR